MRERAGQKVPENSGDDCQQSDDATAQLLAHAQEEASTQTHVGTGAQFRTGKDARLGANASENSMPPVSYLGYGLLPAWMFATFGLDTSGVTLGETGQGLPWMAFICSMALGFALLAFAGKRIENAIRTRQLAIAVGILMAIGSIAASFTTGPACTALGVLVACGLVWLSMLWAALYSRLNVQAIERVTLGSLLASTLLMFLVLAIPSPIRMVCAQVLPVISAVCVSVALKREPGWGAPDISESGFRAQKLPAAEAHAEGAGARAARMETTSHTAGRASAAGTADRAAKTAGRAEGIGAMVRCAVFGLVVPAGLVFAFFPLAMGKLMTETPLLESPVVLAGFVLAFLLALTFLHFSPSVGLPFIFRWTALSLTVGILLVAFDGPAWAAGIVGAALLVVMAHFMWMFFARESSRQPLSGGYVRTFASGSALVTTGIALGSLVSGHAESDLLAGLGYPFWPAGIVMLAGLVVCAALLPSQDNPRSFNREACIETGRAGQGKGSSGASTEDENGWAGGAGRANGAGAANPSPEAFAQDEDSTFSIALDRIADEYGLSAREREVLSYLARGRSSPYIRDRLGISQNTVNTHAKHIYAKTETHSRQELLDLVERHIGGLQE